MQSHGEFAPAPAPAPPSRFTGVYWAGSFKAGGRTNMWTAKIRRRAGRGEATIGSYPSEKVGRSYKTLSKGQREFRSVPYRSYAFPVDVRLNRAPWARTTAVFYA